MVIDNELVLFDNKDVSDIAKSNIVQLTNTYKPMFLFAKGKAESTVTGVGTFKIKVSDKEDMSSAEEVGTLSLHVLRGKGKATISLPIVDKEEFYLQVEGDKGNIAGGKVFVAVVSDVDIR